MATQKLWKLVVEAPLEHHEIERAVADVPAATDPASAIRGVELQRIDVVGGRSFVFASGSAEAAQALEKCLKAAAKGVKIQCAESNATELAASEPPKG